MTAPVKLSKRRNHISAIVETSEKTPLDEPPFIDGSASSTPRMPNSPSSLDDYAENDVFENEFLRILAKVHAALERYFL